MEQRPASSRHAGFTLIEFMIYISIVASVLLSATVFSRMLVENQVKQEALSEVGYNGSFAIERMMYVGQRADALAAQSVYGAHPGVLIFNTPNGQTVIDTYQKNITHNGVALTIRKLRLQEGGAAAVDLTSDAVDVSRFYLSNFSSGATFSVKISLIIQAVNPGGSKAYEASQSWDTTVTVRKK